MIDNIEQHREEIPIIDIRNIITHGPWSGGMPTYVFMEAKCERVEQAILRAGGTDYMLVQGVWRALVARNEDAKQEVGL